MKKILFIIAFFANCLLFADDGLTGLYDFKKLPINEIEVEIASLVPEDIEDPDYTDCRVLEAENITWIKSFLYYPYFGKKIKKHESKITINNQEFIFDGYLDISFMKFYTLKYKNQSYLIITTPLGKYRDFEAYIFDISNPEHILFYPAEDRFVDWILGQNYIGVYKNKLCFFFSTKRFEWNGQYKLSPYYIEGNSLKQLCDKNGNPYFINYSYEDKYEQKLIIEEKYCQ
jgi:hypothetical protein